MFTYPRAHTTATIAVLAVFAVCATCAAAVIGVGSATTRESVRALLGVLSGTPADDSPESTILFTLRLPRVLLGAAVGAVLAVAGVAVQALLRNPLAEPYLLGISSGASMGAAASLLFGFGAGLAGVTTAAFAGAMLAIVLVLLAVGGRAALDSGRLVLAGIAVSFLLGAATNFLVFMSDSQGGARSVLFWTLGSLSRARWSHAWLALAAAAALLLICWLWARRFDAIAIGDDTALSLGVDPGRFRRAAFIAVAAAVACAVAVSGAIGFIGLVVPHIARAVVGAGHRALIPAAAFAGAGLTVCADIGARLLFSPQELPLGIVTALLGTPLLLVLIRRVDRA